MARPVPGAVVVVFIVLFILFNPSSQPLSLARIEQIKEAVAKEQAAFAVFRNSTYGVFAPSSPGDQNRLNLTGLRKADGYKWNLLPKAQERARALLEKASGRDGIGTLDGTANSSILLYKNVSGWMTGSWVRSEAEEDLSTPAVNLSVVAPGFEYPSWTYARNITGAEGKVQLRLKEPQYVDSDLQDGPMQIVAARLTLQDETSYADGWSTSLHGVHHLPSGAILLTTTSEKFDGIFALPHFSLSSHYAALAKASLNISITQTIDEQEADPEGASESPWASTISSGELPSSPLCELVVYLHQQPLIAAAFANSGGSVNDGLVRLGAVEHELRFPSGGPSKAAPRLTMSMLVFSPDCGFILESKGPPDFAPQDAYHLQGPKIEIYIGSAKFAMVLFGLVITAQLLLLVQQMKETSTPSTRSRVSFYTIAIMSLGTGFVAFSFLFMSSFLASMYLSSMMLAFLAFLEGSFFGMKFLMDIWTAQEPERTERERRVQQQRRAAADTAQAPAPSNHSAPAAIHASVPATTDSGLPLPVTAARPIDTGATPVPIPQTPDTLPAANTINIPRPATFGAIYTRYWLLLLFIIFLSIHAATSWPLQLRTIYANTLAFLYLSFWLPQIHRNILRNCRKAFSWHFILGQSVLRLTPFAYLWCINDNVLFVETDRRVFLCFAAWVWAQVVMLVGQEMIGPRWCISDRWGWVPAAWDYHPVLRDDEEGATMPVGYSVSSPTDADSAGSSLLVNQERRGRKAGPTREFDCAICMQKIEAPVVATGGNEGDGRGGRALFMARRLYMVTPCRHIFHTQCLEHWIGYRLQCPICRETLPPL